MSVVKTTLEVGFGVAGPSPPISFEGDVGFYSDSNIHLLLVCPVACTVRASVGTVSQGSVKPTPVPQGVVSFSGSDTSSLPKVPYQSSPSFKTLFAFDAKGLPTSVSFHYDPKTYSVRASKPCYAAASYTGYFARARELTYTPFTETGTGGFFRRTYGVLAAFAPPSTVATHQVEPATGNEVELEIYRIVSDGVTNSEGEFEMPPGYPGTGTYPGSSYVLDLSNCLKTERVHEIGVMGLGNRVGVRTYFVRICNPFQSSTTYKPVLHCVPSIPPELTPSEVAIAKSAIAAKGYGCK